MITELKVLAEKQQTKKDFEKVLTNTINYLYDINLIPYALNDKLFDEWAKNKNQIFKNFFQDKLILEYPIQFNLHLSKSEKEKILSEFCDSLEDWDFNELSDFCFNQGESFFDNKVTIPFDNGAVKIKPNEKIIKNFKCFIKDEEELSAMQNLASTFIQKDKITGIFCISIHPIDYLTISQNGFNWTSCHSLLNDESSYRAGNLSYMCDNSTIVCYIKDEKGFDLFDDFHWNSKKWRMLMHLNENHSMIISNKQYPYELNNLNTYLEYFFKDYYLKQEDFLYDKFNFDFQEEEINIIKDKVISDIYSDDLFYNDFSGKRNSKRNFYIFKNSPDPIPAIIGNKTLCPVCGEHQLTEGEHLLCSYCLTQNNLFLKGERKIKNGK